MKKLEIFILALVGGLAFVAAAVMFFLGIIKADTVGLWYLLLEPAAAASVWIGILINRLTERLVDY